MGANMHITHSIDPTYDERSRVLVLGTMPSPASREGGYNYGHPRNRFWRVLSQLAGEPLPTTNERKRDFCLRHHIALWDVLAECDIEGASDASIRNARPNPLEVIVQAAPIEAVFCTGAKAYELYNRHCAATLGIPAVKLPSTSPANAACSYERLLQEYAAIFQHEHPFVPPVLDVPRVVALEQQLAAAGTPLSELMDRAGTALAHRVSQVQGEVQAGTYPLQVDAAPRGEAPAVAILCGNGNNGGDGWVAARLLAQEGVSLCLVTAKLPGEITAQPAHDAAVDAFNSLVGMGAQVLDPARGALHAEGSTPSLSILVDDGSPDACGVLRDVMAHAQVVVDSIMGTGQARAPRPPFSEWIAQANLTRTRHVTVAVDVPTGTDAQTGNLAEPYVIADETVTMIVPKPGLQASTCGRVSVAPLAYIEPHLD